MTAAAGEGGSRNIDGGPAQTGQVCQLLVAARQYDRKN